MLPLLLSLTGFLLSTYFSFKTRGKGVKKQDKSKIYFKNQRDILFNNLIKFNLFKTVSKFLNDAGNPLGITIEIYIGYVFFALLSIIYTLISQGIEKMIFLSVLYFVPFHILLFNSYTSKKNKIQIALCDIQDIIYFQDKIGTETSIVLASAAKFAKEPLKLILEKTASCYKITRNLDKALDILLESSSLMEIQAFAFTLKQKEENGFSEQNHKAQGIMMKRNKRLRKRIEREVKRNKLIVSAVLLFVCYTFMIAVPMLREAFEQITEILK